MKHSGRSIILCFFFSHVEHLGEVDKLGSHMF